MNKNQFISFIENPDKLSGTESVLLNDLLKNFPYFQTAHLLYAKSLHNQNSIHYNNQLKITAAYATDRKILHRLITKQEEKEVEIVLTPEVVNEIEEKKIEEAVIELIKEEVIQNAIEAVVEEVVVEESKTIIVELPEIVQTEEKVIEKILDRIEEEKEEQKVEEKEVVKEEVEIKSEIEVEIIDERLEELEKEILTEAANAGYEIKIQHIEPLILPPEPPKDELKVEVAKPVVKPVIDVDSISFTDWLKHLNESDIITETTPFEAFFESETKPLDAFDLIDKFIKEEPKLSRPKAEFYNPVNMAKQSVAEDITFVSETLAKIYELQGNYSKALKAYENLHLKYPEKRLYFAAQIKNLSKLINQQKEK